VWCCGPMQGMASSFMRFLDHTRPITVGRTPLDECSTRRRDLYLTTHNTHNRQTSTPLVGFVPMISAGERPQPYALDHVATGTGDTTDSFLNIFGQFPYTIVRPELHMLYILLFKSNPNLLNEGVLNRFSLKDIRPKLKNFPAVTL